MVSSWGEGSRKFTYVNEGLLDEGEITHSQLSVEGHVFALPMWRTIARENLLAEGNV